MRLRETRTMAHDIEMAAIRAALEALIGEADTLPQHDAHVRDWHWRVIVA